MGAKYNGEATTDKNWPERKVGQSTQDYFDDLCEWWFSVTLEDKRPKTLRYASRFAEWAIKTHDTGEDISADKENYTEAYGNKDWDPSGPRKGPDRTVVPETTREPTE